MAPVGDRMKVQFLVPSRGLFGYRNEFLTATKGEGIMASVFEEYAFQTHLAGGYQPESVVGAGSPHVGQLLFLTDVYRNVLLLG